MSWRTLTVMTDTDTGDETHQNVNNNKKVFKKEKKTKKKRQRQAPQASSCGLEAQAHFQILRLVEKASKTFDEAAYLRKVFQALPFARPRYLLVSSKAKQTRGCRTRHSTHCYFCDADRNPCIIPRRCTVHIPEGQLVISV